MSRIGSLALLLWALPVSAQPITSVERMPPLDRARDGFHGAIVGNGPRVVVTWRLSTPTVERGKTVELFLLVEHAANPNELMAPPLAELREWKDLFESVENLPPKAERAVEFAYRLKPRNVGSFDLPLPVYRFYLPQAQEGKRFQTALIQPVALTVTEPVAAVAPAVPLNAPPEFFHLVGEMTFAWGEGTLPGFYWVTTPLGFLLVGIARVMLWRWRYPDAAKQARWRKRRCVDVALKQLAKAKDAAVAAEVFRRYLHERGLVSDHAQTTQEIIEELTENPMRAASAQSILEAGDRARFGRGEEGSTGEAARQWVEDHESRSAP